MSDSNKSAGIAKLEGNELGWSNLVSFQRSLLDYASSKHTAVMESIKDGEDMDPPAEPPPNAPPKKPDYQSAQPFLQVAQKKFKVVSTRMLSPVVINVTVK